MIQGKEILISFNATASDNIVRLEVPEYGLTYYFVPKEKSSVRYFENLMQAGHLLLSRLGYPDMLVDVYAEEVDVPENFVQIFLWCVHCVAWLCFEEEFKRGYAYATVDGIVKGDTEILIEVVEKLYDIFMHSLLHFMPDTWEGSDTQCLKITSFEQLLSKIDWKIYEEQYRWYEDRGMPPWEIHMGLVMYHRRIMSEFMCRRIFDDLVF